MTTPLSQQKLGRIAGLLDHHSPRPLDPAELQLAVRYACLSDENGHSAATTAELLDGLCARKHGMRASRKALSGGWRRKSEASPGPAARQRLEGQHRLARVAKTLTERRSRRTGARKAAPCDVTLFVAPGAPFAYQDVAEWLAALLDDTTITSTARSIGLRLARAFDPRGHLCTKRKQLAGICVVKQQQAIFGALDQLQGRGLIEWSDDRTVTRPWPITIRATITAHVREDDAKSAAVAPLNDDTPIQATAPAPLISTAVADDGAHHDVADDQPFTGGSATEEEAELYRRLRRGEDVELPSLPVPHAEDVSWDEYDRLLDRLAQSEAQAPVVVAPVVREETGGQLVLETAEVERETEPPNPRKSAAVSAEPTPTAAALLAREASPETPASASPVRGIRIAIKATAPSSPTDASATVEDTLRHESDPDPEPEAEPEPIYVTLPEPFPVGAVTQIRDLCAQYPHGDRPVRINGEPLLRYRDGELTTVMDSPGLHKGIERIERKYAENAAQVVRV